MFFNFLGSRIRTANQCASRESLGEARCAVVVEGAAECPLGQAG